MLRQIAVDFAAHLMEHSTLGQCLRLLSDRAVFPSVERICVCDSTPLVEPDEPEWWRKILAKFGRLGIGFEYPDYGNFLVPLPASPQTQPWKSQKSAVLDFGG